MQYVLVLLADWANGLFAMLAAAWLTDTDLQWWFIPIALLASHLPDIDAVPELLQYGRVGANAAHGYDHRQFLHYPIISLLVCSGLFYIGNFWALLVAIAILLHLLNDFYGTGWGLQLFWPLSHTHYKLLGRRANRLRTLLEKKDDWESLTHDERRLRLLVRWSATEVPTYIQRWGVVNWIEYWYLHFNWISVTEYILFVTACVMTALMFIGII